jgi:hypothetical protein
MNAVPLALGFLVLGAVSCNQALGRHVGPVAKRDIGSPSFAYGSPAFRQFVADSYALRPDAPVFDSWLNSAYKSGRFRFPDDKAGSLTSYLKGKRQSLGAMKSPSKRAQAETELGGWMWKFIKANIPQFSLDRGYEFTSVVATGERQCLLQSVLLSGLLQTAGVHAGAAMVYRNIAGNESNNGHVVSVLKRSDGRDILVDCSDPEPFVRQQGLFMVNPARSTYAYVRPQYAKDNSITAYVPESGGEPIPPARVHSLGTAFLRSQFEFYRGERSPGGFAAGTAATPEGLRQTLSHLETARKYCPDNPLVVYLIGRIRYKLDGKASALEPLSAALTMYSDYGHIPSGMADMAKTMGLRL